LLSSPMVMYDVMSQLPPHLPPPPTPRDGAVGGGRDRGGEVEGGNQWFGRIILKRGKEEVASWVV